jgi:hypothetical protein
MSEREYRGVCWWDNHNRLREMWLSHGASFHGLSIACDFAKGSECLNIWYLYCKGISNKLYSSADVGYFC